MMIAATVSVAVPPDSLRQQLAEFVDAHLAGLGIISVRRTAPRNA